MPSGYSASCYYAVLLQYGDSRFRFGITFCHDGLPEDRSFGFDKGTIARLAFVTLAACLGFAGLDDVLLSLTLQLPIIITVSIRAEVTWLG